MLCRFYMKRVERFPLISYLIGMTQRSRIIWCVLILKQIYYELSCIEEKGPGQSDMRSDLYSAKT